MLKEKDLKPGVYFAVNSCIKHKPHQYHHIHIIVNIKGAWIECNYVCTRNNYVYSINFPTDRMSSFYKESSLHRLPKKEVYDLNKFLIFQ